MSDGLGDPLGSDGLNAARALILGTYYMLRRTHAPEAIGTAEILAWIAAHEPGVTPPSTALVQLTLAQAGVAHRGPGRPSAAPPFCAVRSQHPKSRSPK
jgi:hypothetical protein